MHTYIYVYVCMYIIKQPADQELKESQVISRIDFEERDISSLSTCFLICLFVRETSNLISFFFFKR